MSQLPSIAKMCGAQGKQTKQNKTKIFKTRKQFSCANKIQSGCRTSKDHDTSHVWNVVSYHLSRIKSKLFTALHNMEFLPSSSSQDLRKLTLLLLPILLFIHSTVWVTVRLKFTSKSSTPWLPSLKDFIPPYCSTSLSNFTICILCTFPCLFLLHNID